MHLNPHNKKFPALNEFQNFCGEHLKGKTFKGLYFDTKESEQYVNKLDRKNEFLSKMRLALYGVLIAGVSVGLTYKGMEFWDKKMEKKLLKQQRREIFENRNATWSGDMAYGTYEGEKKTEVLQTYENNVYERFLFRYGNIGKFSEQQFRSKIVNILDNQDVLDNL